VLPGDHKDRAKGAVWLPQEQAPVLRDARYVEVVDELPRHAVGRVMKHQLRDRGIGDAWDFEEMGLTVSKEERR